jgi:hypothetical protein
VGGKRAQRKPRTKDRYQRADARDVEIGCSAAMPPVLIARRPNGRLRLLVAAHLGELAVFLSGPHRSLKATPRSCPIGVRIGPRRNSSCPIVSKAITRTTSRILVIPVATQPRSANSARPEIISPCGEAGRVPLLLVQCCVSPLAVDRYRLSPWADRKDIPEFLRIPQAEAIPLLPLFPRLRR